ncbi:aminotransferase [Erythrobacter sp. WG]|uniref:aminotransferase n=1 Tax=Erythrobacter sp. WG TaxID=2985510 RepID=UPI00226EE329|nr:aminotransferase [Erythrobacter sp. WG]MCX9147440.1 aminotransferase [Erythrobacter sp. WG]
MNPIYRDMGTTIFEATSARARARGAINLGQGFPDGPRAEAVIAAAAAALQERSNQYPPMAGLPELRAAVAAWYGRHQGLALAPEEVTVTSGATEALAAALLALVCPGDEVIIFEPAYDAYRPLIERTGGVVKPVALTLPEGRIDRTALAAALGPRTRLLLLNDPLNPLGTRLPESDLAHLAEACTAHDLTAICDEVWEALVYDGARHRSLMDFPGMRERTVKIGSAGKIFGLTGWKVGWMCAAAPLAQGLARAHQFLTFTTPPNLQWAVAEGLVREDGFVAEARAQHQAARDHLRAGLAALGLVTLPAAATYFVTLDLAASGVALSDREFCATLIDEAGVAAIPVSAFCAAPGPGHLVRFCFAKERAVLDEALARLAAWRAAFGRSEP